MGLFEIPHPAVAAIAKPRAALQKGILIHARAMQNTARGCVIFGRTSVCGLGTISGAVHLVLLRSFDHVGLGQMVIGSCPEQVGLLRWILRSAPSHFA
jgi:hypothetical protein